MFILHVPSCLHIGCSQSYVCHHDVDIRFTNHGPYRLLLKCVQLQSLIKGPGLKGIAYTLSSADVPSAFDFSNPPSPLSVPKDSTRSPPVNPGNVMNNSSSSPMPSALAPSQPKQQGGSSDEQEIPNPFAGLFDSITSESAPDKSSQVPSQFLEVAFKLYLSNY